MRVEESYGGWAKAAEDCTHLHDASARTGVRQHREGGQLRTAADWEIGDTAGLETCATEGAGDSPAGRFDGTFCIGVDPAVVTPEAAADRFPGKFGLRLNPPVRISWGDEQL